MTSDRKYRQRGYQDDARDREPQQPPNKARRDGAPRSVINREHRTPTQSPQSMPKILAEVLEPAYSPGIPRPLLMSFHAAEAPVGQAPGFFGRHAGAHVLADLRLDVEADGPQEHLSDNRCPLCFRDSYTGGRYERTTEG